MTDWSVLPLPELPARAADSHKGDFGRVLLVGGSRGMSGAISLAGMSACRSGAGLVTLAVPDPILEVVAGFEPSYMTVPLASDAQGRLHESAKEQLDRITAMATVVACGPGLGRSDGVTSCVRHLYRQLSQPMVIDADGLNALAARPNGLADPGGPRVLTPHPGELRRLLDADPASPPAGTLREQAIRMASQYGLVMVLKGSRTLITDGTRRTHNLTGNPGLATGGTGDVLTGLIAALVGQGLEPFAAAQLGVYLHGVAGDLAAARLGQISLIARDVLEYLPAAFQSRESHC